MYLAGLSTFFDSPRYQTLLLASSAFTLLSVNAPIPSSLKNAEKSAGKVKREPLLARICTTVHGPGTFGVRALLLGISAFNMFYKRKVLAELSLPDHPAKQQIQLVAVFADLFAAFIIRAGVKTLGSNFAFIGTRERSSVVASGPFKYVRHPLYDGVLVHAISNVLVFWNWIPLTLLPCVFLALVVKIPLEEQLILEDPNVRDEYKKYQKNVRWRLFPGIW
ncbi:hypothetical protein DL96DRAFT_1493104 [Flagelloscypha sp. PMI_526]|nr:hypothetical protein DL96DRAFT_1493104 [Flagelloscypha sp. PMI_526]